MTGLDDILKIVNSGGEFTAKREDDFRAIRFRLRQKIGDKTCFLDRFFSDLELANCRDYSAADMTLGDMAAEWNAADKR